MPKKYQKKNTALHTIKNKEFHPDNTSAVFYIPTTKKDITKSTSRDLKFQGSGYIKGIVKSIYYSKKRNSWIYYIKGTDLSNGKLNSAKVYGIKKLAHINDFVYAIIKNGYIKSIYIYKSSKSYILKKKKKIIKKRKQKKITPKIHRQSPKKRQRKQVISAPVSETITF
jgi:hypothetical protein